MHTLFGITLVLYTTLHFTNIQVKVTWRYYLAVRYAYDPQYSTTAFILTLTSNNMSMTLTLADSLLQADSRSVTTTEALSLTANQLYNITVSLTSTTGDPVDDLLVDSLVLKPDLSPSRIRSELDTLSTLLLCFSMPPILKVLLTPDVLHWYFPSVLKCTMVL